MVEEDDTELLLILEKDIQELLNPREGQVFIITIESGEVLEEHGAQVQGG